MKLLLGESTQAALTALAKNPGGAYLFYGPAHTGKATAAKEIAVKLASHSSDLLELAPEGRSIGIDTIHELNQRLQLKRISQAGQRVVVIDSADSLTREAQNALLATLEEPPEATMLILIAERRGSLLPTILSRLKTISFSAVPTVKISQYLVQNYQVDSKLADSQAQASGGAAGQAVAWATNPEEWQQYQALEATCQRLLEAELLDKVLIAQAAIKDGNTQELLDGLTMLVRKQLRQVVNLQDQTKLRHLVRSLSLLQWCQTYLAANGNQKYALDRLVLELSV